MMSRHLKIYPRKLLALAVASCFAGELAYANPTGPTVTRGQASFATQGNTLTVTNSPGAIINWQGFSIPSQDITRFLQQSASSAVLNRVSGATPSTILGQLQSNGRVYLINPNGITIGKGSVIDVAGFVASSLNLSDADFIAGRHRFTETPGAGAVVNQGTIKTPSGGMVYLVGQNVENHGIIKSPQGEIVLAAGKSIELVDAGTPEIRVQITAPENQALNLGQLLASGGRIGMYGGLVRQGGVANANTAVVGENGKIVFKATKDVTLEAGSVTTASGPSGGSVRVQAETGTLLASGTIEAKGDAGKGGTVQLLGDRVGLIGSATVDASGESGGGTVLVGGDFQGKNPDIQNAFRTYFGPDAAIKADAIESGDGGKVIVWADDVTRYFGSISARGGAQSGNGGFAEVSGYNSLIFSGKAVLSSAHGTAGTLLLDPNNINILNGGAATLATATGNATTPETYTFAENAAGDSSIDASAITVLTNAGTNVTLQAHTDIAVNEVITSTGTGALTLQAGDDVAVNSAITIGAGGVTIVAGDVGGTPSGVSNDAGRNIVVSAPITTLGTTTSGTASGSVNLTSNSGNIAINSNITTGNASVTNAAGTTIAQSGNITVFATGGGVSGNGVLTTGSATLTGNTGRVATDAATSGSIAIAAGTGGVNLGGANSLTIGTSNVTPNQGTATVGNISIASGGAINSSGSSLQANFGAANSGGSAATRVAGKLSASTSAGGAGIFVASPSASLVLSTITADGNVVLQGGTDITLSGPVSVTGAGSRFTAQAGRHVNVNAALTTNNGKINLEADSPDALGNIPDKIGQLTITAPVSSNGGTITLIAGGNANTSNSITGPDGNVNNVADNSGFRPIAIVDAGAGGINLALSRSTDELGIGVTGTITQILGNGVTTPGFGSIANLRTTGPMVIGKATTAGTDGLGTGAQTLTVDRISNTYNNSYIALTPIVAGTFELVAGSGGILLDQPLTTFQPATITTTGTLTISDPINTSGFSLTLPSSVTITSTGSINTGGGSCSGTGCPVTTIFWDGGGGVDTSWFNPQNWSTNTLPTLSDDVTIASGGGAILISSAGALAKSLIANRSLTISGSGSLTLSNASQFSGQFTLSGGTLTGTGSAAVTGAGGSLLWSGGTMNSGGSFLLGGGNGGTLSNTLTLNRLFENQGTLTLSGASINGTGSIVNSGLVTATSATTNTINTSLANVIVPTVGTIQLSGAGTTLTATNFPINDGQIVVGNGATFSTGVAALINSTSSSVVVNAGNYSTGGSSVTTDVSGNLAVSGALNAGAITLLAGGSGGVTLNAGSTVAATGSAGDSIVISGASFTNNSGSGVLNPGSGRWLVYSSDPAGNTFGPSGNLLSSGNTAIWGQSYPTAVAELGNRYVFANTGTVTVTTADASKTYGDAPIDLSANYALFGKPVEAATYGNVYLNSAVSDIFSAGPTIASSGNTASTNVGGGAGAGGAYAITGTGTPNTGYSLTFANSGLMTINRADYTAISGGKTYDGAATFTNGQVTLTGVNSESFNVAATADSANASLNSGATKFVSAGAVTGGGNYNAVNLGTLVGANNVATINQAVVSLAGNRAYDSSTNFGPGAFGTVNGVNGETLTVASGSGTVVSPKVLAGTQSLTPGSLALGNGTGLAGNYKLAGGTHTGTIAATTSVPFAWDGSATDLRWENPVNWNQGAVPLNGAMASIPGGLSGPVVYSSVSGATSLKTLSSGSGFMIAGGTLTLGNSAADVSTFSGRPLTLNGGTLNGTGTISLVGTTLDVLAGSVLGGSRTIMGNVNNLEGTVSPGASPGIMTIDGNYYQGPLGTLLAEIGGPVAGAQYDQLIVTGTVTLGGALNVALVNGFIPATNDAFTIVQSGAVSGTFASESSTTALVTNYLDSSVTLTNTAVVPDSLLSTQINLANNATPDSTVALNLVTTTNAETGEREIVDGTAGVKTQTAGGTKSGIRAGVCK